MSGDIENWEDQFTITDKELDEIRDARWLYTNLVIEGHILVIAAEPNGGKTTIFEYIASQIALDITKDVIYINADIASSNMRRANDKAKNGRYKLLLPDIKLGMSMNDVVKKIIESNKVVKNLDSKVYIFDTLKKMADVINKHEIKGLMKVLRGLTAKGATIILLAHTNKYKDSEDEPIFEGTGDVKADADELIYLLPLKKDDGSMVVSTKPDKVRGDFKPITFNISSDRVVTQEGGFTDIEHIKRIAENQELVNTIKKAITLGFNHQAWIIDFAKKEGKFSKRKTLAILKTLNPEMWTNTRGGKNNKLVYGLVECAPHILGKVG